MEISEQGLALIRGFEGFSATPYLCPGGKPTIGYGHVIGAGEAFPEAGISRETAETMLKQDVKWAEQAVRRLAAVALSQNQFDALVCLVYNIGAKAFEKSTLLRILNSGDPEAAARQFSRWVYASGRKLPGLERRRAAETLLFTTET